MLRVGRYGTRDVAQAKAFYGPIAELLGAKQIADMPEVIGYKGAEGGLFLVGKPFEGEHTVGNGAQMTFTAPNREVVDQVHAKAIELGGKCEGPPGQRQGTMYGAYFRDLDGNKAAVFHFG